MVLGGALHFSSMVALIFMFAGSSRYRPIGGDRRGLLLGRDLMKRLVSESRELIRCGSPFQRALLVPPADHTARGKLVEPDRIFHSLGATYRARDRLAREL